MGYCLLLFDLYRGITLGYCSQHSKHSIECEDLFLANGLNVPLKENSYDIVFSHYVIEQMKGFEEKALDNMIRIARKGVVLFETAVYQPTINQYIYETQWILKRSSYNIGEKKRY